MTLHDLTILAIGRSWPPPTEAARLKTYTLNQAIIEGNHNTLTTFNKLAKYLREKPTDKKLPVLIDTADISARSTNDLLLGTTPTITVSDPESAAETCIALQKQTKFARVVGQVAEDLVTCGVGIFKVGSQASTPTIQAIPPEHWYPVAPRGAPMDLLAHVVAWTFEETQHQPTDLSAVSPKRYLYIEIHTTDAEGAGYIEHRLHNLSSEGKIGQALTADEISAYPEFADLPAGRVKTGVTGPLVVPVFNRPSSRSAYGRPGISPVARADLEALEILLSVHASTLWAFGRPDINAPKSAFIFDESRGRHIFQAGEAHMIREGEQGVEPVVWDIQGAAMEATIDRILDRIYESLELSPALISSTKDGGGAESGKALRFRLLPTLAKVDRARDALTGGIYCDGISLVLSQASKLAASLPAGPAGVVAFEPEDVTIVWADSLPVDQDAQAERHAKLKTAALMSTAASLRERGYSEEAIEAELVAIRSDLTEEGRPLL